MWQTVCGSQTFWIATLKSEEMLTYIPPVIGPTAYELSAVQPNNDVHFSDNFFKQHIRNRFFFAVNYLAIAPSITIIIKRVFWQFSVFIRMLEAVFKRTV